MFYRRSLDWLHMLWVQLKTGELSKDRAKHYKMLMECGGDGVMSAVSLSWEKEHYKTIRNGLKCVVIIGSSWSYAYSTK